MNATTILRMEAAQLRHVPPQRLALGAAIACVAGALLWFAASAHLRYSCVVRDTPYLPICDELPTSAEPLRDELRDRIHRNPGDAWAWSAMVPAVSEESRPQALQAATELAPNNATVLRWRAASALEGKQLQEAIALLVQLLQHRSSKEAAQILAQLTMLPEAHPLLQLHLKEADRWLPRVVAGIQELKLPPADALPVIVEAARQGALPAATRRQYMQLLRGQGQWLDAYGLWVSLHKREVPLLYNGSFDQQFVADGFDWEFTPVTRSRAGVTIEQQPVAKRGLVLSLDFSGRRFALPIIQQYVFAPPGGYRLEGQYMASKLRSEGGLAWSVFCPGSRTSLPARSDPIRDSGGLWRTTEFEFTIPAECGPIARLQLETYHAYEATAGIKGHVELDGFTLKRVD